MKMQLSELLKPWINHVDESIIISGIQSDSRKIQAGDCFLALPSGQQYISQAINNGAVAVIYSQDQFIDNTVPCYLLPGLAENISQIASRFYHEPTKDLNAIAVTGTNGKTTIAYLLTQAYAMLGRKTFYVGTLGVGDMDSLKETGMTTPDPIDLQKYCYDYVQKGYQQLIMEVSSHALHQFRVDAIVYQQAIFTNLTHDHLDYHGTMEAYAQAKARLFRFPELQTIIVNSDDPMHDLMLNNISSSVKVYRTSIRQAADIRVVRQSWSLKGMHLDVETPWGLLHLDSSLIGQFNVHNILAVLTSLMAQDVSVQKAQTIIASLKPPPGRMEVANVHPLVVIDFAHTPDALENALMSLKTFQTQTQAGDLWVVFGCGGDRDPFKRPAMGKIAGKIADHVVLTSDNPRTEKPFSILQQIELGVRPAQAILIEDRKSAIQYALEHAKRDDIILIAGKGHEDYQIIGQEKVYFSDHEVVKNYLIEG